MVCGLEILLLNIFVLISSQLIGKINRALAVSVYAVAVILIKELNVSRNDLSITIKDGDSYLLSTMAALRLRDFNLSVHQLLNRYSVCGTDVYFQARICADGILLSQRQRESELRTAILSAIEEFSPLSRGYGFVFTAF